MIIYPENWVELEPPTPITLTQAQKDAGKAMIKDYINGLSNVIPNDSRLTQSALVSRAQTWIRNNTSKHIPDSVIIEILQEIYDEWSSTWTFLGEEE